MTRLLARQLATARNYRLKKWAEEVAKQNNTTLSELGLDRRDNECLRDYLLENAELITQIILNE